VRRRRWVLQTYMISLHLCRDAACNEIMLWLLSSKQLASLPHGIISSSGSLEASGGGLELPGVEEEAGLLGVARGMAGAWSNRAM
jgi:hypothetical protein